MLGVGDGVRVGMSIEPELIKPFLILIAEIILLKKGGGMVKCPNNLMIKPFHSPHLHNLFTYAIATLEV